MRFQPCQACAALVRGYCCPSCREVEEYRRQCEARAWLARTKRDPARIKALLVRIASKRGQAASDELRDEMRRQWRQA